MSNHERAMVEYALGYAKRGWRVFPLHTVRDGLCTCGHADCSSAGKHPRTKNGVKDATTDQEQISRWWQQWPDANIGIATGQGLYVIDVDCHKGSTFCDLGLADEERAALLESLLVRTGSGGVHLYLSYDSALWLPNTSNKLGPFIDTRGEGGYVVAPPSRNGQGRYRWEGVRDLLPITPALLAKLLPATQAQHHPSPATTTTPAKEETPHALSHEAQAGATQATASPAHVQPAAATSSAAQTSVAKEARNNFMISMAGKFRHNGCTQEEIRCLLLTLNETRYGNGKHPQGPLSVEELERTILKSVAKYQAEGQTPAIDLSAVEDLPSLMNREIPEPVWIVPGLLAEGLTLIAGKSKAGKSWLMVALALTCAAGEGLALERFPINAARVLYLSLEDPAKRFQERVRILLAGRTVPPRFDYALRWNPLTAGGFVQLESYLDQQPETKLIVIDTLAKVRLPDSGKNGNLYLEEYQLMGQLQSLALSHHVALVVIHHLRKMKSEDPFDEIAGSTGLVGAADTLMVLDRKRGHDDAILHLTGRDIEEQKLALLFSKQDCTWTCTGTVAEQQTSQSKQAILDLLQGNEAMSPKEVAEALEKPQSTIKSALSRMVQEGLIVRSGRGRYTLSFSDKTLFDQVENEAAD